MVSVEIPSYVKNEKAGRWVREMAALCKPDAVYWCDGSQAEYDRMCETLVAAGFFILNIRWNFHGNHMLSLPEKMPNYK